MGKLRLVTGIVIAVIVAVAFTTGAGAAQKTGCPSGEWQELTVQQVAEAVWPTLLDPSPWSSLEDFRDTAVALDDANGDGSICIKQQWGDSLNPNSHWYLVGLDVLGSPTVLTIPRDNNANG